LLDKRLACDKREAFAQRRDSDKAIHSLVSIQMDRVAAEPVIGRAFARPVGCPL